MKVIVRNLPKDVPALPIDSMPIAPGSAKAGEPAPAHVKHQGPLPHWLDPSKAKWTKARVAAMDQKQTSARPSVHIPSQQEIEGRLDVLRRAASGVRRPQGLR